MTSNVGQNYPYTSESEADRAATVARLVSERDGLAATLSSQSTPLDANERWWVWKCPTPGCPGLLHAAGYAAEKHAVFVVCDGIVIERGFYLSEIKDYANLAARSLEKMGVDPARLVVCPTPAVKRNRT